MTHYFCPGEDKGVSDKPGVCQDLNCSRHGKELKPCDCGDPESHKREASQGEGEISSK